MRDEFPTHNPLPAVAGDEIRRFFCAEAEDAGARKTAPIGGKLIVGIDDGRPGRAKATDGLAFSLGRAVDATEALEMFRAGVGDDADAGLCERHQLSHITNAIRAELDDRA